MAYKSLTLNNDYYDAITAGLVPRNGETGNKIAGLSGNDTILGSSYDDFIFGDNGNDYLNGRGGNDWIHGGSGNDTLLGDFGNDKLYGDVGDDLLYGGSGTDTLWGGAGSDNYIYYKSDGGIDTINDNKLPTGEPGGGDGSVDYLFMKDMKGGDIRLLRSGKDLLVTDAFDLRDGVMNIGVKVEDYFLGGNNKIEYIVGSDNIGYNLQYLA
jgi:hypothetical protein